MNKAAEVKGLSIRISDRMVVDDVGFDLVAGRVTSLVGESGSGKTLTALAMLDLLPGSAEKISGEVFLNGVNIFGLDEEHKRRLRGRRVSMVFQEPFSALNPLLKVGVQIKETILAHEFLPRSACGPYIEKLLRMVKLSPDVAQSYPHELSGGMRQRIVLAIALCCEPDVLVLDEPTTALDVFTQKEILDLIEKIQAERQFASLFITHDFSVVNMVADEVCVMREGKVVERGTKQKILTRPENEYTKHLLDCIPRLGDKRRRLPVKEA